MELVYASTLIAALLGLVMGSFAGATVWRLRARQLADETAELQRLNKKTKLSRDEREYKQYLTNATKEQAKELKRLAPLNESKVRDDRSRCLECGHTLHVRDLMPLVSWLSTKGRCRYCKAPIGRFEPAIELATAAAFALFTFMWLAGLGVSVVAFVLLGLWLVALTMLAILFAYDLKWFILPDRVVLPFTLLSGGITTLTLLATNSFTIQSVASIVGSVAILSGLYYVLWLVSKGKWVGFGDVKLGIGLGILLIDWKLAFLTLFLANFIGTLVVLPGLLTRRLSRTTHVPFGPLLIVGFFISAVFGSILIQAYQDGSVWLSNALLML